MAIDQRKIWPSQSLSSNQIEKTVTSCTGKIDWNKNGVFDSFDYQVITITPIEMHGRVPKQFEKWVTSCAKSNNNNNGVTVSFYHQQATILWNRKLKLKCPLWCTWPPVPRCRPWGSRSNNIRWLVNSDDLYNLISMTRS